MLHLIVVSLASFSLEFFIRLSFMALIFLKNILPSISLGKSVFPYSLTQVAHSSQKRPRLTPPRGNLAWGWPFKTFELG